MESSDKMLLNFYGDDFTGSTDVMETLAMNGIKTMLFITPPTKETIEEFEGLQSVGIAGTGRSLSREKIAEELSPVFKVLEEIPSYVTHYKVCSTFDSSPEIGSIGRIIEIAGDVFTRQAYIPVLVGTPALKRYTVFGNHFVNLRDIVYRLDRHPIMSRHPVTPMSEADLVSHLSKQTDKYKVGLIDIIDLEESLETVKRKIHKKTSENFNIILFDALTDRNIETIGEILWEQALQESTFMVGSSGVEDALTTEWKKNGWTNKVLFDSPEPVDQMIVISGSCSEVTKEQVQFAMSNGFTGIQVPVNFVNPAERKAALEELYHRCNALLTSGKSLIFYTALGPDDQIIEETKQQAAKCGLDEGEAGKLLAEQIGVLCKRLVVDNEVKRLVVAGGDTSGYVMKEMSIDSIEMVFPIIRGVPLCKCYSGIPALNSLQVALKGGQMGDPDFFVQVKNGENNSKQVNDLSK